LCIYLDIFAKFVAKSIYIREGNYILVTFSQRGSLSSCLGFSGHAVVLHRPGDARQGFKARMSLVDHPQLSYYNAVVIL
jgi:hypothetical protein